MNSKAKETAALLTDIKVGDYVRLTDLAVLRIRSLRYDEEWCFLDKMSLLALVGCVGEVVRVTTPVGESQPVTVDWGAHTWWVEASALELVDDAL